MSVLEYAIGVVLAVTTLAMILATPVLLVHSRSRYDHGPGCWWCHPHMWPRKKR